MMLRSAFGAGRMGHLRLVLMSATLNAEEFASFFWQGGAPCSSPIHVEGRMFPVDAFFFEDACQWTGFQPQDRFVRRPMCTFDDDERYGSCAVNLERIRTRLDECTERQTAKVDWDEQTLLAVSKWKEKEVYSDLVEVLIRHLHTHKPKGDGAILVFMPGWKEISDLYLKLADPSDMRNAGLYSLILHSLMTPEQQHQAFEPAPDGKQKIVIATNIAEASVTIDDVVYVVDSAVRKERIYRTGCRMSALEALPVTKANVVQRR